MKYFNVAGPCIEGKHYMLDATERLHNELIELINSEQYYVIHAARQVGKTTLLFDLTRKINNEGDYYALYCSLENAYGIIEPEKGIKAIVYSLRSAFEIFSMPAFFTNDEIPEIDNNYANVLKDFLTRYARKLDKPLVIFFDEADCLSEGTLLSFLRQLRNGYINRSFAPFPVSVALVGMRNIRDYKAKVRENQETIGSVSPFNIITSSLTLRNFNKEEVQKLYQQHTDEMGQIFENAAIELAFEQTQGQPWLVNAIAREIIIEQLKKNFSIVITAEMVSEAIKTIILRRDVHIDQLLDKLKDPRVQRVIEPLMLGEDENLDRMSDDFCYVKDLGLIRLVNKGVVAGNPIYGELIIRTLNYNQQATLQNSERFSEFEMPKYFKNNSVDMTLMLQDFQHFWRENSDVWQERFQYKEAAPHLILQAFLQRIFNSGGEVQREMATGRDRLDLCITYKEKKYPIELKIDRGKQSIEKGIEQTLRYMDTLGCKEGWLVVFDRDNKKPWDEKIYQKIEKINQKTVNIFGC